jgi:hypothetical protein
LPLFFPTLMYESTSSPIINATVTANILPSMGNRRVAGFQRIFCSLKTYQYGIYCYVHGTAYQLTSVSRCPKSLLSRSNISTMTGMTAFRGSSSRPRGHQPPLYPISAPSSHSSRNAVAAKRYDRKVSI